MKIKLEHVVIGGALLYFLTRNGNAAPSSAAMQDYTPTSAASAAPQSVPYQQPVAQNDPATGMSAVQKSYQNFVSTLQTAGNYGPVNQNLLQQAINLFNAAAPQGNAVEAARAAGQAALATGQTSQTYIETGGATRYTGTDVTGPIDYQGNPI